MRAATCLGLAVILTVVAGCGGDSEEEQAKIRSLEQRILGVEAQLERATEGLASCRASVREIDQKLSDADFHINHVPQLVQDIDAMKGDLARTSKILQGVSRKDNMLVLGGMMVADDAGNPRCLVSASGLAIWDASGRRVGELEYDEAARAMSASLRGYGTKSVALYAGQDRVAIGAYDTRENGTVGWAATVNPEGQVSAGKAGR
jgi:hypothetical protein